MELQETTVTHLLEDQYGLYLNEFLKLGWRIMALKKERIGDESSFAERIDYLLGASTELALPERYLAKKEEEESRFAF